MQELHGRILEPPSSCKSVIRSSDSVPMKWCHSLYKTIRLRMKASRAKWKKKESSLRIELSPPSSR